MKKILIFVSMITLFSCNKDNGTTVTPSKPVFTLTSKGIQNGIIDKKYGGNGLNDPSIPLEWKNSPEGTQSYAIVMLDHDAISVPDVGVSWIHWTVANLPKEKQILTENESRTNTTLIQGVNTWISSLAGSSKTTKELASFYGGPNPPKDHTYTIVIYALDTKLDLQKGFFLNELYKKMKGHILAVSQIEGIYKKS